jgi:hypothetical protein
MAPRPPVPRNNKTKKKKKTRGSQSSPLAKTWQWCPLVPRRKKKPKKKKREFKLPFY